MEIRRAGEDDAEAIARVLAEAFEEFRPLYTAEAYAATTPGADAVRERLRDAPAWVVADDGAIVGTVAAVVRDGALYVRSMAVLPSARGRGISAALLAEVERFAIESGIAELTLSTTPFLHAAIALYERFGFVATGPQEFFGTPLFGMRKLISASR